MMIHKLKPELTLYLAEEALKKFAGDTDVNLQEILELQRECRDYLSTENIRRLYARMMKVEVMKMMVKAVYQSLSPEEKKFVDLKYKKKKHVVSISLAMNMSLAQLNIRHHAILHKVSEFMLYELDSEDIFSRGKIISMVTLLDKIIEFAEEYDPTRKFIDGGWLEAIRERHDRYVRLLEAIERTLSGESLRVRIIAAKMQNPHEKIEILAARCNVDKSIVSRHLKHFVQAMKKYLE